MCSGRARAFALLLVAALLAAPLARALPSRRHCDCPPDCPMHKARRHCHPGARDHKPQPGTPFWCARGCSSSGHDNAAPPLRAVLSAALAPAPPWAGAPVVRLAPRLYSRALPDPPTEPPEYGFA